jgi:hypothetical protein
LAKKSNNSNGSGRLEEAMAMLIQNQAAFLGRLAESDRATAERFRQIEKDISAILRLLSEQGRILSEHGRLLERLPEAVRDKIGFKSPQ